MPQFNTFSVAETAGRGRQEKQQEQANALIMDARKYELDETKQRANTEWLAGASKYAIDNPGALGALVEEGKRRGIFAPEFNAASIDPSSLPQIHQEAITALGGFEYTDETVDNRTMQRDTLSNKLTPVSATPRGPTSPEANFAKRQDLVSRYGEDSPQVRTFDAYVRAPQYQTVNQVPTQMTPSRNTPLSTLESESAAAAEIAMAEGEGGRGRVQQPDGSYVAVAGTEADIKEKEARKKRGAGAYMKSIQAQTVVEDTTRLREQLQAGRVPFRREAALQEKLDPLLQSEDYRNAISLIESVKGNVGIDSLLRIKASGAGLGQVPQTQLDMLSRLLGELDLKQGEEQFTRTWDRMEQIYTEIMNTADEELAQLEMTRPDIFQIGDQEDTPVLRYNAQGKRIQ